MTSKELSKDRLNQKKLQMAIRAHERTRDALQKATAAAYPVGGIVCVRMGRSRINGEILHSGGQLTGNTANVQIRNVTTGKERTFSASWRGHEATLMHFPKK